MLKDAYLPFPMSSYVNTTVFVRVALPPVVQVATDHMNSVGLKPTKNSLVKAGRGEKMLMHEHVIHNVTASRPAWCLVNVWYFTCPPKVFSRGGSPCPWLGRHGQTQRSVLHAHDSHPPTLGLPASRSIKSSSVLVPSLDSKLPVFEEGRRAVGHRPDSSSYPRAG